MDSSFFCLVYFFTQIFCKVTPFYYKRQQKSGFSVKILQLLRDKGMLLLLGGYISICHIDIFFLKFFAVLKSFTIFASG